MGWGGEATRFPITVDDFELICQRVSEAAHKHDLILLNAGSSAGSEDFSAGVVEETRRIISSWSGGPSGASSYFWNDMVRNQIKFQ